MKPSINLTLKPETVDYLKSVSVTHYDTTPGVDCIYFFRLNKHQWQMCIVTPIPCAEFDHVQEWYRVWEIPVGAVPVEYDTML